MTREQLKNTVNGHTNNNGKFLKLTPIEVQALTTSLLGVERFNNLHNNEKHTFFCSEMATLGWNFSPVLSGLFGLGVFVYN